MALTDTKLKNLKSTDKVYKVVDRDGMYVVVSLKGTLTFRYDWLRELGLSTKCL